MCPSHASPHHAWSDLTGSDSQPGVVVWMYPWAEPSAWWDGGAAAGGGSSPCCAGQDEAKLLLCQHLRKLLSSRLQLPHRQKEEGCPLPTVAPGLTSRQPYNPPAGCSRSSCQAAVAVCGSAAACVPSPRACPCHAGPPDRHSWGASLMAPMPWKCCWFGSLQNIYGLPISTWVLNSLQCVASQLSSQGGKNLLYRPRYAASICVPWFPETPHVLGAPGRTRRTNTWVSLQDPVLAGDEMVHWCWSELEKYSPPLPS